MATGHDADLHCGKQNLQCHLFQVAVNHVRAGAPNPANPVLVLDKGDLDVVDALDKAFLPGTVPRVVVDPTSSSFATQPIDTTQFSAIIVASDKTCGGCDLNTSTTVPDSIAILTRKPDIEAFFNAGGGIFALSGADHGDGPGPDDIYYAFLPLPVGGKQVTQPFTLTPEGVALGFEDSTNGMGTNNDINCCPTHNSFAEPPAVGVIKVAERDKNHFPVTIFAEGVIEGGAIVPRCFDVRRTTLRCATDGSDDYFLDVLIRNLSGGPIHHIKFTDLPAGASIAPISLAVPIPDGSFRNLTNLRIKNPGGVNPLTFKVSLHNADLTECCSREVTLELPPCDCAQLVKESGPSCFFPVPPPFRYNFTLENLTGDTIEYLFVTPFDPGGGSQPDVTIIKSIIEDISLAPVPWTGGQGSTSQSLAISGPDAGFGDEVCFYLSLHDAGIASCCSIEKCLKLPTCGPPPWEPVGDGRVRFTDDRIVFFDLADTGEDGLSARLGQADSVRLEWASLDRRDTLPIGSSLRLSATGSVDGEEGRGLGEVVFEKSAGKQLTITPDLTAIGSTTQRLEVYRKGELVATREANQAPVVLRGNNGVLIWPRAVAKLGGLGQTSCYAGEWGKEVELLIEGLGSVTGDELRILSEASETVDHLENLQVLTRGIPKVTVVDAERRADCNQNSLDDDEELGLGLATDTNGNSVLDLCEIPVATEVSLTTGFDQATGTLLPIGSLPRGTDDDDWTVLNPGFRGPAKLVIDPPQAWGEPEEGSRWLSISPNRGRSQVGVARPTFERCFEIPRGTASASVALTVLADDEATVLLNGESIGGPGGGFSSDPLLVSLDGIPGESRFMVGTNCLTVEVNDFGRVFTGFSLAGAARIVKGAASP